MSGSTGRSGPARSHRASTRSRSGSATARSDRELLLDRDARVEAIEGDAPFGEPGPPFDRRSPFRVAFLAALGVATAYVVVWSIFSSREILLLIALAFVIAVGLEPAVTFLMRHHVRRGFAVLAVVLLALAVLGGFLALAIPPLVEQIDHLVNHAPEYVRTLTSRNSFLGHLIRHYHIEAALKKDLSGGGVGTVASGVIGAGKVVVGILSAIVVIVALTIYFLADLPRVTRTFYRLIPHTRRARAGLLIDEGLARVGGYMLGNLITSFIAGLGTFIWLEIFGVPYALLLSVFVALMDLIPIVGSTVGGIVVSLVALSISVPVAGATAGFYIAYRNAEDYLLTPRVMNRTVEVPGLVTVIAVLIGGVLFGILGALLAIPIAAAIKLVLDEVAYPRLDES